MNVKRKEVLALLKSVAIGLSSKEMTAQSNCFVFHNGKINCFNGEILSICDSPLGIDVAVEAEDLLKVLEKFPDDDLEITQNKSEIIIKGKKRSAGITCSTEIHMEIDKVPKSDTYHTIKEGTLPALLQAARTCGSNESQPLTTCVHVTPEMVEACDNFKIYRCTLETGFPEEILIHANIIEKLIALHLEKVSQGKGWVYFKTKEGLEIAVRCSHQKFHKGIDSVLQMTGEKCKLPQNLPEIVDRAKVMMDVSFDSLVSVSLDDNEMEIEARKENGWFREKKKMVFEGPQLQFHIHPDFLLDIMKMSREITVNKERMKIEVGNTQFATVLQQREKKEESE